MIIEAFVIIHKMQLFPISLVVCCLAVGFVLSLPLPEEEASTSEEAEATTEAESAAADETTAAGADDAESGGGSEKNPEGGETNAPEAKGEGSGKDDRLDTYNKVNELLDKGTGVNNVENGFLRAFLDNNLQSHLRVPVIDAIGLVGDFSKIAGCFTSMDADVKKIVDDKLKSFTTCKSGKEAGDAKCSEDGSSVGGQFDQITSKIKECVSSKGKGK